MGVSIMREKPHVPVPPAVRRYFALVGRQGGLIGGKSTSKAKVAASRANGKLGGRPRKEKS
jgi:hypothetical protein